MIKIKRYLICLLCGLLLIPVFGYAINGANNNGYAPVLIGGKTLYAKFVPTGNDDIASIQLTFHKRAEFLEKIVYRVAGMKVKEATERLKAVEVLEHGKYAYTKLDCNNANLTIVLGKKQFAHPAGSILVMKLKFSSETSGSFVGHFTKNGDRELKGTFELK
jgi:hypothetical protein